MAKRRSHHHHEPVITLTPAEEVEHRASHHHGRGEVEVIGLLGLATLIMAFGLLAVLAS